MSRKRRKRKGEKEEEEMDDIRGGRGEERIRGSGIGAKV